MATTYKVGDYVLLNSIRPPDWSMGMNRYLNTIVRITNIYNNNTQFTFNNSGGYIYRITNIASLATKEMVAQLEEENRKKEEEFKEKYKHYIYEEEALKELAISVFGEERVYTKEIDGYTFLYIHFPEIIITNSKDQKHLIRDLYIEYNIRVRKENFDNSGYKLSLGFSGKRTSLSLKEHESSYRHSHLTTGNNHFGGFCLGSSDYSLLLQSLQIEPTEDNWMLILLGLENYLSWESLEGGPYITLDNLKYNNSVSSGALIDEVKKLAGGIPTPCWEFIGSNLGLIPNHPLLYDYFDKNSTIRNLHAYSKEQAKQAVKSATDSFKDRYSLEWKGKNIDVIVYEEDVQDEGSILSREVVAKYCEILSEQSNQFLKQHQYERGKERNERKVFGKIRA
jgi:hypothetical protein